MHQGTDGLFHLHQVYTAADPVFTGKATVPVIGDRACKSIVNNESSEIIRMLNASFQKSAPTRWTIIRQLSAPTSTRPTCSYTNMQTTGSIAPVSQRRKVRTKRPPLKSSRDSTGWTRASPKLIAEIFLKRGAVALLEIQTANRTAEIAVFHMLPAMEGFSQA